MSVWRTRPRDAAAAAALAAALGIPEAAAAVLAGLGLRDPAAAERFLSPRLRDLSDPFLLPDMPTAVDRLLRAIERREALAIFGDYDVDGIVSTGLLLQVLERLGAGRVTPFLPNRGADGYGLSRPALERCLAQARPGLLVTVDCGTNEVETVDAARRAGVDVIVTDHHERTRTPAAHAALALVNPKLGPREDLRLLAGVGVVFKLCHGLVKAARRRGWPQAETLDLRTCLDWVAVGTVADIVPLQGENRILVRHGLAALNNGACRRWAALAEVAGLRGPLDTRHIAFGLAPRLNAAGRLGDAGPALELLITPSADRARDLARELDGANRERQRIEGDILRQIDDALARDGGLGDRPALVIGGRGWNPGVIGIVAARLVARYQRPAVVVAFDDAGRGRGSCRSLEGFHLVTALARCRAHLLAFGGHGLAAGVELDQPRLAAFREAFEAAAAEALAGCDRRPVQRIDAWTRLDLVDDALEAALDRMRPFGQNNPEPVLAIRGAQTVGAPRPFGKQRQHLRFVVADGAARRAAVAFNLAAAELPDGALDLAFAVRRERGFGSNGLELQVRAVRPAEPGA